MRRISIDYGTIWVCQCCMLSHANGECCADDLHGGDGIAPWSDVDFDRFAVAMGLLSLRDHDDACEVDPDTDEACGCERREFSTSRCDGCGSSLAGERHAFWLTRERMRFPRPMLPA
jgi:hypothetical protein